MSDKDDNSALLKRALTEITGGVLIQDANGDTVMNSLRFEARQLLDSAGKGVDGIETQLKGGERIAMRRRELSDGSAVIYADSVTELRRTEEELWRLAHTDPLTGLENRTAIDHLAKEALGIYRRYDRAFSLIRVDVTQPDDFLSSSDSERIIIHVGKVIRHGLRLVDHLAHLGNGRYLAFMPETDLGGGLVAAQRLEDRVARSSLQQLGKTIDVLVKAGVASAQEDDDNVDQMIERAQKDMASA